MDRETQTSPVDTTEPPCGYAGCAEVGGFGFGPPGWPKLMFRCRGHRMSVVAPVAGPPAFIARTRPQADLFGASA